MPELAGSIDLTTDSIEGGTAALRRQTEAWKENAKAQAYQDALSEIYAAQAEAELEREKNLVLVRNAEADLRDMETERNELIRQRQEMESDPSLYDAEKYQQMEQRLLELNNEYFDADVNLGKFQEALAESDRLLADAEQKTKEYDDALKNLARRTSMEVEFDGASITKSIRPYLLGLTYTDNEEGQADDLRLCLQDRGGLWRESWLAAMLEGAVKSRPLKIRAAIVRENWTGGGRDQRLDCGSFELDAAELSTPKGGSPMYRDFGLDQSFLDKPLPVAKVMLRVAVKEAIEDWEPRASFVDMAFSGDAADPASLCPVVTVEVLEE